MDERLPVGIVDYAAGNSASVLRALRHLGLPARMVTRPAELVGCSAVVLPGVGAAGATMRSLAESGLDEALDRRVREGLAYVGICVGLQVLFEHSEEDDADCLGWLPGSVRRLPASVRVPQIGWNLVTWTSPPPGIGDGADAHYYFVNSYVAAPAHPSCVAAEADYGGPFPAVVHEDNVFATQFHLEKSGPAGLALLSRLLAPGGVLGC